YQTGRFQIAVVNHNDRQAVPGESNVATTIRSDKRLNVSKRGRESPGYRPAQTPFTRIGRYAVSDLEQSICPARCPDNQIVARKGESIRERETPGSKKIKFLIAVIEQMDAAPPAVEHIDAIRRHQDSFGAAELTWSFAG